MVETPIRHYFQALDPSISNDGRLDEKSGLMRQVSLISLGEAKGHKDEEGRPIMVDGTSLEQIFDFFSRSGPIKLKADHGSGVLETIGWVDNYTLSASNVRGDAHIYDTEESKPKLFEIAKRNPNHMGISLEFDGQDEVDGDECLARCDEVFTCALVSDPAANKSLYEKKIAKIRKTDNTKNMAKKNLSSESDPGDGGSTTDDVKKDVNDFDAMFKKCEEMFTKFSDYETRLSKMESLPSQSDKDNGKDAPKATDPQTEPATQNKDADKTFDDSDGDSDMEKKMEKVAEMAATRVAKTFAAKLGINLAPGGQSKGNEKEKTWSEMIEDTRKEFGGDRNKATAHLLKQLGSDPAIKKAYAAQRPVGAKQI